MDALHDIHKRQIASFTQYFATKRSRVVLERDAELEDFKTDKLMDDSAMFNCGEVEALLNEYHAQVMGRLRDALENQTNLSAVFIGHLLTQAEGSGMALQVEDVSVIEDNGQVSALRGLSTLPPLAPKSKPTLQSMEPKIGGAGSADTVALLQQVQDLEAEKKALQDRNTLIQTELTNICSERTQLSMEVQRLHEGNAAAGDSASLQLAQYQQQVMLKQEECDAIRAELNARLQESAQFQQLNRLLQQKNQEVKMMKQQLMLAGLLQQDGGEGVDLVADD